MQCRPNVALIGEEIAAKGTTLREIVEDVASLVTARAALGLHYGVVLVPEGLLSFIPEVARLMEEINEATSAELRNTYADGGRSFIIITHRPRLCDADVIYTSVVHFHHNYAP